MILFLLGFFCILLAQVIEVNLVHRFVKEFWSRYAAVQGVRFDKLNNKILFFSDFLRVV